MYFCLLSVVLTLAVNLSGANLFLFQGPSTLGVANESSPRVENAGDNVDNDVSSGTDGMCVFHEGCNVCKWYIVVNSLTKVLLLPVNTPGTDGKYFFKRSSKICWSY